MLLIDASGSMETKIKGVTGPSRLDLVTKAVKEYVAELPLESRVYLAAFNKAVYEIDQRTLRSETQRRALINSIDSIQQLTRQEAAGTTHLWAALEHALEKGNAYLKEQPDGTVVVRVLTDGGDNDKTTKWAGRPAANVFAELQKKYPQIGNNISANLILLGSFDLQLTGREGIGTGTVPNFRPVLPPTIVVTPAFPKAGERVRVSDASKQLFDTYDWWVDGQLASREREFSYTFTTAGQHSIQVFALAGRQKERMTLPVLVREADKPEPMNPSFRFEPTDPEPGDSVKLFGRASGKPVASSWTVDGKEIGGGFELEQVIEGEGPHTVVFTVRDAAGREERVSSQVTATERPLSVAFHSPAEALAGTAVVFNNLTRGKSFGWQWAFGDDAPSNEKDPLHRFVNSGDEPVTNRVILQAKSRSGRTFSSDLAFITIHPTPKPPKPAFQVTDRPIHVGDQIAFANNSRGVFITILWDFGGEGTSALRDPDFTFKTAGEKNVTLTLTGEGGTAQTNQLLTVLPREIKVGVSLVTTNGGPAPELGGSIDFGKINPTHLKQGTLIGLRDDSLQVTFSSRPEGTDGLMVTLEGATNAFQLAARQGGKSVPLASSVLLTEDTILQVVLRPSASEQAHEAKLMFAPRGEGVFVNGKKAPAAVDLRADLSSESLGGILFLFAIVVAGVVGFIIWKSIGGPVITPASLVDVSLTEVLQNPVPGQQPLKLKTPLQPNEVIRFGMSNAGANHVFDLKAPEWSIRRDKSSVRLTRPNQRPRNLIKLSELTEQIKGSDGRVRKISIKTTYKNPVKTDAGKHQSARNTSQRP